MARMSSGVLGILAGLLAIAAVVIAVMGLRFGSGQAPVEAPPRAALPERVVAEVKDVDRTDIVVAARALPAFSVITEEDVLVERVRKAPAESYTRVEDVVGKTVWIDVGEGHVIGAALLEPGGPLARTIRSGERALAVAVDEVIGLGGFAAPGDFVDVVFFAKDESVQEVADRSRGQSAQVLIKGLRLLTYGERIVVASDGHQRTPQTSDQRTNRHGSERMAVLSVPEAHVARLMLASQTGNLRLAVRSHEEGLHERYLGGEQVAEAMFDAPQLVTLDRLLPEIRRTTPVRTAQGGSAAPRNVEIIRGTESRRETP